MKSIMRLSTVGSVLALAGALAFSGQVAADTVTANYTGMSSTKNITYSVILPPGSGNPATSAGTTTGIFNFTNATGPIDMFGPANNQFVSFCIDLQDTIGNGGPYTWDVVGLAAAPDSTAGPMGITKAENLAKLLGFVIGSNLNDARTLSDTQKQALQLAVWEVVHENQANGYNVMTGDAKFRDGATFTSNTSLQQLANDYLAGIIGATAMKGLVGLTSTGRQDFIGQVPIPAAAWLFGSALLGVAALGRRNRKQTEENESLA